MINTNGDLKIIELRNYLLKPDQRKSFHTYFTRHFIASQNDLGGYVLGQFRVFGERDKFFWIRGFETMEERSRFLPEFYYGAVWKEFGNRANEMMIDSDDVYLLKPLDEKQIFEKNKVLKIDYYFAKGGKPDEVANLFQTQFLPFEKDLKGKTTLWRSELSENDFPRLPVFQYENLLVVITALENEAEYQAKLNEFELINPDFKKRLKRLISKTESLILYEI